MERILGAGGMGVVVAATHLDLHQQVALKFMRPEAMQNPQAVGRFLREARAAVQLRSPHVGRILDVGTLDGRVPYIVMEYLDGQDLAQFLAARGRVSAQSAADVVLQTCDALAEAHTLGIVHRDLKPANIFLARAANGATTVKVLDFGISKVHRALDASITGGDALLGSPGYMSPEQMRSARDVDPRTDIWSLGVILYQAVAGALPFDSPGLPDLCLKVLLDPPPPLPPAAHVAPGFEGVIRRCLEKDPAARYPNIAALSAALAPFCSPASRVLAAQIAGVAGYDDLAAGAAGPHAGGGTPHGSQSTLRGAAGQAVGRPHARRWWPWAVAAAPAVAIVALVVRAVVGGEPGAAEGASAARGDAPVAAAAPAPAPAQEVLPPPVAPVATVVTFDAALAPPPPAAAPVDAGTAAKPRKQVKPRDPSETLKIKLPGDED